MSNNPTIIYRGDTPKQRWKASDILSLGRQLHALDAVLRTLAASINATFDPETTQYALTSGDVFMVWLPATSETRWFDVRVLSCGATATQVSVTAAPSPELVNKPERLNRLEVSLMPRDAGAWLVHELKVHHASNS